MSRRPKKLYVWSGSLHGVCVEVADPDEAVDRAVRANLPCVLGMVIRVSLNPQGSHPMDVFYESPYEEQFPRLFGGDLDVQVAYVEER